MPKKKTARRAEPPAEVPSETGPGGIKGASKTFAFRFAVIAATLLGVYAFPYAQYGMSESWFDKYLSGYARLVGWVLGIFEADLSVQGATVIGRTTLRIAKSCDAMEAKLLLASAVLAFPGRPSRKAVALLIGLVSLTAINVMRIVTLYFILVKRQQSFELFHLEVLPLFMILAAVGLFILSIKVMRQPTDGVVPAPTHAGL